MWYILRFSSNASSSSSKARTTKATMNEPNRTGTAQIGQPPAAVLSHTSRRSQIATARLTIEAGRSQRHPNSRIWSVRTRCRDARTHTKNANIRYAFSSRTTNPGVAFARKSKMTPTYGRPTKVSSNGNCQPPRKNSAKRMQAA